MLQQNLMIEGYSLHPQTPDPNDYLRLRVAAGLTARSQIATEVGLPNTVTAVVIRFENVAVGMGRVVGDGLFYQVVDIAVEPQHQGRGLGKDI